MKIFGCPNDEVRKKILTLLTIALGLVFINHSCKPDPEEEIIELGSIYGIVTDKATGEPVKNANVQLRPSGETSLTGNDGRYEFLDLKNGNYSITVSKTGYTDLVDDYVITVEGSKAVRRDVQIEVLPAALKIVDDEGNDISELDFGDNVDDLARLFNIFNNGISALNYEILKTASWITSISSTEGSIQPGATKPIVINIDRDKLSVGDNKTTIQIISDNGSKQLTIKAYKLGDIATLDPTNVTLTSATLRGSVNKEISYSEKGFNFWSDSNHTSKIVVQGNNIGEFFYQMTALEENTTYYYMAYMVNNNEVMYGEQKSFTTAESIHEPTIVTNSISDITQISAIGGGNITSNGGASITARGVCWSTLKNPTVGNSHTTDGTGEGEFSSNITGLTANTTYYVRAYATNSVGTSYGEELSFTTSETIQKPTVVTNAVTNITQTTALCSGNVTSNGGAAVTAKGMCWSTTQNPTISNSHSTDGTGEGEYTSKLTNLSPKTTYYVRAYAANSMGTNYGEQVMFTTNEEMDKPAVITKSVGNITQTSAQCGGEVTDDGGTPVTSKGVCWSTAQNPTINNSHTSDGSGDGEFTSNITGLSANTTYYVRAYATNSEGTSYGEQKSFTTLEYFELPTVTTYSVSSIMQTTASCGGYVSDDGGANVTAKGVCWSTSQNPTISDNITNDGTGEGAFTSTMTGLEAVTTYYVRAYATNSEGTSYGEERSFTTSPYLPTVITYPVTQITDCTAIFEGNIVSDGGAEVTERGFCWSTSHYPTTSNNHTIDGNGIGNFTSNVTSLLPNTKYYVRAYAINNSGTGYGDEICFTTEDKPSTGVINGHEYVDLGLPSGLKWATCNVGANSPEMPGGYYAWGELETKDYYSSNNSLTYEVEMDDISGDPAYDVAAAEWGSTWRMPKLSEINEMKSNCYYPEEIEINGRKCYKYTSAINGASIILPHTGEKSGYNIYYYNAFGCYWSSTPYQSNLNNRSYAKYNYGNGVETPERFMGLSIRPVSE